jgi:predicted acylesterase/phospholipase RssA
MFHNIALSGGGIHTIAFIGCVKYLQENHKLDELYNVIGSSGGSIICLMLVLNYTHLEMTQVLKQIFNDHEALLGFSMRSIFNLSKNYGLNNGKIIILIVESIFKKKNVDVNITFIDLIKRTGKNIIIATTNLSKKKIEYLSVDTYPEMKVMTAIRMSTCVPIIFEPVKYYNDIYVDSFIYNNFPIDFFDKFTVDTLGLNLVTKESTHGESNVNSFRQYVNLLFESFYTSLLMKTPTKKYEYVCEIPIRDTLKNFDAYQMKFVLNEDVIHELVNTGYEHLHLFLNERN